MNASNRATHRVFRPFHGRPWAEAFNVVMATTVVSIASRDAGFEALSAVLLGAAIAAFVSLAGLDVRVARHPLALLRRAGQPGQAFHALGFVAAACVLGIRIAGPRAAVLTIATVLLASGAVLWVMIFAAVAVGHSRGGTSEPRGEWLLTVVATEGLAILAAKIAGLGLPQPLRPRWPGGSPA
jgi:hypothetical protein